METILVVCDNCGAKPKPRTSGLASADASVWFSNPHSGWAKVKVALGGAQFYASTGALQRVEFDLCPQCVQQLRVAEQDGYPNAPERVA